MEAEIYQERMAKAQEHIKELETNKAQLEECLKEESLLREEPEKLTTDLQLQLDKAETRYDDWECSRAEWGWKQTEFPHKPSESKAYTRELSSTVAELEGVDGIPPKEGTRS